MMRKEEAVRLDSLEAHPLHCPAPLPERAAAIASVGSAFPATAYSQEEIGVLLGLENRVVKKLLRAQWVTNHPGQVARRIFLLGEDLTAEHAFRLGLVDVVDDTVDAAVAATIKAMRPVTPEAACFTRRILDDCYLLEPAAAAGLAKAARYKLEMPEHDD